MQYAYKHIHTYIHTYTLKYTHIQTQTHIPAAGIFGVLAYRRILRSSVAAIGLSATSKACQQPVKQASAIGLYNRAKKML